MAVVVITLNIAKFLQKELSKFTSMGIFQSLLFYKFLTVICFLILIILIIEPEKLKYPAYIAFLIILINLFIFWMYNLKLKKEKIVKIVEFEYSNFSNVPSLIGNYIFSIESIASTFTIRATLKKRSDMFRFEIINFIILLFFFTLTGISFLTVN